MAATGKFFGKAFLALFNKEIDWDSDTIKVLLTTSAYTPDQDAHDYKDDVTDEVSGTGYSAGGQALSSKTITYTSATNKITLDAADVQWASSSITARHAVIYDDTPATAATKPLLGYQSETSDVVSTNGNWDLIWNASGIFEITVA